MLPYNNQNFNIQEKSEQKSNNENDKNQYFNGSYSNNSLTNNLINTSCNLQQQISQQSFYNKYFGGNSQQYYLNNQQIDRNNNSNLINSNKILNFVGESGSQLKTDIDTDKNKRNSGNINKTKNYAANLRQYFNMQQKSTYPNTSINKKFSDEQYILHSQSNNDIISNNFSNVMISKNNDLNICGNKANNINSAKILENDSFLKNNFNRAETAITSSNLQHYISQHNKQHENSNIGKLNTVSKVFDTTLNEFNVQNCRTMGSNTKSAFSTSPTNLSILNLESIIKNNLPNLNRISSKAPKISNSKFNDDLEFGKSSSLASFSEVGNSENSDTLTEQKNYSSNLNVIKYNSGILTNDLNFNKKILSTSDLKVSLIKDKDIKYAPKKKKRKKRVQPLFIDNKERSTNSKIRRKCSFGDQNLNQAFRFNCGNNSPLNLRSNRRILAFDNNNDNSNNFSTEDKFQANMHEYCRLPNKKELEFLTKELQYKEKAIKHKNDLFYNIPHFAISYTNSQDLNRKTEISRDFSKVHNNETYIGSQHCFDKHSISQRFLAAFNDIHGRKPANNLNWRLSENLFSGKSLIGKQISKAPNFIEFINDLEDNKCFDSVSDIEINRQILLASQFTFEERLNLELANLGLIDIEIDKDENIIVKSDFLDGDMRIDDEICIFIRQRTVQIEKLLSDFDLNTIVNKIQTSTEYGQKSINYIALKKAQNDFLKFFDSQFQNNTKELSDKERLVQEEQMAEENLNYESVIKKNGGYCDIMSFSIDPFYYSGFPRSEASIKYSRPLILPSDRVNIN